ncbi:Chromate resistance protein ChrB [Gryllotalpicola sp.]|uniref:Chromate resistance protein ChrB n=1 Tax=Gryllotalpicola sp. TaxID=1932787 RepID=UPI002612702D|nr:Chromate resistance protein ChrB [Gryllotalpicola sp.]
MPESASQSPEEGGRAATWLLLVYRIPSEPTRLRATVWRRLKALGAVYLQNSAATLPKSAAAERALRKLQREILQMSGTAVLLESSVLAGEQGILSIFQSARTDEYEEIMDRCEGFLAEVEKEYAKNHFTYAELEENEVDYNKLASWLEKVKSRDEFGAPGRAEAEAALARCERSLEEYATRVYSEESEGN